MHSQRGFNLLELLVTISIVAVLTAIAIPGFDFLNNRRIAQTQVENLQRALTMARQTAISRNRQTVVCPSSDGSNCEDATAWTQGFMIYEDVDDNETFSSNVDKLLEFIPGVRNVAGRQSSEHLQHQLLSNKSRAAFNAQGFTTDWQTFTYCDNEQRTKFEISLIATGRIKVVPGDDSSCQ